MAQRRDLRPVLFGTVAVITLTITAAAQARDINIPAEDLRTALDTYIRQSGVQLVYADRDVDGLRSHAVEGHLEPVPALDQLLQGTQLAANRDVSGAVIVSKRLAAAPDTPAAGNAVPEQVTVTGSRVISDITNSPTPLTVVTAQQLQATTPSNIPDALNKLPIFQGSTGNARATNNASTNSAGNTLNLRNFGTTRTLVLLDGHRVAPTNADGSVDIDTLPQMLMSRVDVVTGGASAVYGSDAVTGVVNFILDKNFTGLKTDFNAGISTYADGASYKAGLAAGSDFFGGRMHVEMALEHYHADGIPDSARPEGLIYWLLTGAGTAAAPFTSSPYTKLFNAAYGGKISCTGCAANNQQFTGNGVISPFNPGTPTQSGNISTGQAGDGTVDTIGQMTTTLTTDESFLRASYQLDDTTSLYVQGSAAQSRNKGSFTNWGINTGTAPNTFFATNPYLSPAAQTALANPAGTFKLSETIVLPGAHDGYQTNGLATNFNMTAGLDGVIGKYNWDVYYTHGESRLKVDDPWNINQQHLYAAEDAVLVNGAPLCFAATQAATAAAYAGCVPINPFGTGTINQGMANYIRQDTFFVVQSTLNDVGGSVSGDVFDLPAGPVKAALSAESRWMGYSVASNALPTDNVNCTGLRNCSAISLYGSNVSNNRSPVSENVWEMALEADVPLLHDMPMIQSLDANVAGRYTDYSTSGSVETWKIGLDWHVTDEFRLRATNSIDIRAPTLNDLFAPTQQTPQSFTDIHTGNITSNNIAVSQGNPNLVPEVARTYTAGIVFTPEWLAGFNASVDYYSINLKNAITSISPSSNSVKLLCESSGGTSPFCALYVRPFPFSNTTAANFPTQAITESLNASVNTLEGWDFEANYGFNMGDVWAGAPGSVSLRLLSNYQPVNEQVQFPTAPLTFASLSKTHVTAFVGYDIDDWSFGLEDRWWGGYSKLQQFGVVYTDPHVRSVDYLDINLDRRFMVGNAGMDLYFTVQNIGNTRPPVDPINGTNPGLYFMSAKQLANANQLGYDAIGRYFTIGLRTNL